MRSSPNQGRNIGAERSEPTETRSPELEGDPNRLREMIRQQAQLIREEEVAVLIGAALGENNPERATWRNGYRARAWKTRAGEVETNRTIDAASISHFGFIFWTLPGSNARRLHHLSAMETSGFWETSVDVRELDIRRHWPGSLNEAVSLSSPIDGPRFVNPDPVEGAVTGTNASAPSQSSGLDRQEPVLGLVSSSKVRHPE